MSEASSRAAARASEILQEFGSGIPVPVEEIAKSLGATVTFEPLDRDVSGVLYRDGEVKVIAINTAHAKTRQRFTLAHELGHMVLHGTLDVHVDRTFRLDFRDNKSSLAIDRGEIEANAFAAELLMPKAAFNGTLLQRAGRRVGSEEELIAYLARAFKVSPQAMENRLVNLNYIVQR